MALKTNKYRIVELINGFYVERLDKWEETRGWFWNRYIVDRSEWRPLHSDGNRSCTQIDRSGMGLVPLYVNATPVDLFKNISEAKNLIDQLQTPEEDKIKYPIYHNVD